MRAKKETKAKTEGANPDHVQDKLGAQADTHFHSLNKHRHVAPLGNQYWKARKTHGKKKIFRSPESLLNEAYDYFQWCVDNPLHRTMYSKYRGKTIKWQTTELNCVSIGGLCLHLGISRQTFLNYSSKEAYRDYFEVCEHIADLIYMKQFMRAAVGHIKPCVIARSKRRDT